MAIRGFSDVDKANAQTDVLIRVVSATMAGIAGAADLAAAQAVALGFSDAFALAMDEVRTNENAAYQARAASDARMK